MKKILAKSRLVIIEAGIEVLAQRIKKKLLSSFNPLRSSLITLFADSNVAGTMRIGSLPW